MRVKYTFPTDCRICMDLFPNEVGTLCRECKSGRTLIVDLVNAGNGFLGNKAVIAIDGSFKSVPLESIHHIL